MERITLVIFFFTSLYLFSQKKQVTIIDSQTNDHIQYANIEYIKSKIKTFSDSLGYFKLDKNISDKVIINVLGYEPKVLQSEKIKDTIFLKPKTIILDEVSINTNFKKIYGYHSKKGKFLGSSVKRAVVAIYIQNKNKNTEHFISTLHFKIKKRGKHISIVRPHLYTINTKTQLPDKEILDYNILIKEKQKGKKTLSIDISDKNITFPKEGVFIALEWVGNTNDIDFGYNEIKKELTVPTLLTSLDFKKRIWTPMIIPGNSKSICANFGITTCLKNP
ncbi:carboxypeptidase-like regulatory domain-containing protein [Tenacibaculum mesophilum]|uniref:carboxypeptidase-like regulatory domain-containing protein n=1 Tax=Tenacibaculum mesophilum TaxID=104268 RepID=UPI00064B4093|nr:carboxypeptidase-like regulatory domain-containing protein [Tenacibaculum mesophilum]